jgi:exosortase
LDAAEKMLDRAKAPFFFPDKIRSALRNPTVHLQVAMLAVVVAILYYDILRHLVGNWLEDSNYSHAFLVPLFAGFLVWERRQQWMTKRVRPEFSGILLIFGAMVLLLVGTLGAELFLSRVSFVILLGGLTLYFAGWPVSKSLFAPWLLLFLMIPLPVIVFNQIAFPLQTLASHLASSVLTMMHVPVVREGNVISLPSITLNVVEACSGIRSLMSLATLALMYGLVAERRIWVRGLLVLLAIPAAVGANALRIVGAALLGEYAGPQYAEGFFHAFSGWLIFVLTMGLLVGLHAAGSRIARRGATT